MGWYAGKCKVGEIQLPLPCCAHDATHTCPYVFRSRLHVLPFPWYKISAQKLAKYADYDLKRDHRSVLHTHTVLCAVWIIHPIPVHTALCGPSCPNRHQPVSAPPPPWILHHPLIHAVDTVRMHPLLWTMDTSMSYVPIHTCTMDTTLPAKILDQAGSTAPLIGHTTHRYST